MYVASATAAGCASHGARESGHRPSATFAARSCLYWRVQREISISLNVPETLAASAERALLGCTTRDAEIDALPVPARPRWLRLTVRALRWYRQVRPAAVSQRCVWDPSCSRYAEVAFRSLGLIGGFGATISRLRRCRPGRGGADVLERSER